MSKKKKQRHWEQNKYHGLRLADRRYAQTINNIIIKINQCRKLRVQEHHRPNKVPISMNHTRKTPYSQ